MLILTEFEFQKSTKHKYSFVFVYKNGKTWSPSFSVFENFQDAKVVAVNFGMNRYGSALKKISFKCLQ